MRQIILVSGTEFIKKNDKLNIATLSLYFWGVHILTGLFFLKNTFISLVEKIMGQKITTINFLDLE